MTIVCIKDAVMCADGLVTYNSGFQSEENFTKIITPEPGDKWYMLGKRVIGMGVTGNASMIEISKDLFRKGIYYDTTTYHAEGYLGVIAVTEDLDVFVVDLENAKNTKDGLYIYHVSDGIHALGTGTLVAKSYMIANKSARKTVEFMIKSHALLGGKITEVDFKVFKKELADAEAKLPKDFVFVPKFQTLTPKEPQVARPQVHAQPPIPNQQTVTAEGQK